MLRSALLRYRRSRRLVGFCKWKDGAGLLFGRVMSVGERETRFELVHPDGSIDEEIVVALSEITRVEESHDYVERLMLFQRLSADGAITKSKGQTTTNRSLIKKRLTEAHHTHECVDLTLKGDPRHDYRVLDIDDDWVELEEHGDDPFKVTEKSLVRFSQIDFLRWRSTNEQLVTIAWKTKRKR